MREPSIERLLPTRLELHERAWVAPGAVLVGDVQVEEDASVWYGCVLRGDLAPIRVGPRTNIQDLSVVHVDTGCPAEIGAGVTVGHGCVVHGCVIEDEALIGMGSVVLSGARIGRGALIAAGAVVREGFEVPPNAVVSGVPGRVRGEVDERLRERILEGVERYVACAAAYRAGRAGGAAAEGGADGR